MALIQRLVMLGEGIALLNALDVLEELDRGSLSLCPARCASAAPDPDAVRAQGRELSAAAELMAASIESRWRGSTPENTDFLSTFCGHAWRNLALSRAWVPL
jgi:hypothetical protein